MAQVSIAWLLHQKAVTSVLIGAKRPDQLKDDLKAVEIKFSKEELSELENVSKLKREYPQWLRSFIPSDSWKQSVE